MCLVGLISIYNMSFKIVHVFPNFEEIISNMRGKIQWDITSHQSEWSSLENMQTINAGEDVEKKEPSYYCVGGNVNW